MHIENSGCVCLITRSARCVIHMYSAVPPLMLYRTTEDVNSKLKQALFVGTIILKYTSLELILLSQHPSNPNFGSYHPLSYFD